MEHPPAASEALPAREPDPPVHPPASPPQPPEAPPEAAALFGPEALARATAYAGWLANAGVERGLLGPREVDRIWSRHLLNCAALGPLVPQQGSICDLGSGAGLPGLVLALMRPEQPVTLLEPIMRRTTFLTEVVADLGLTQVSVVRARADDYARSAPGHEVVVARAVAPLGRLVDWALPLLQPGGVLLAQKGESVQQELADAAATFARWSISDHEVVTVEPGGNVTHVVRVVRPGDSAAEGR